MNFDESVSYIYSLGNEVLAMKFGLETIRALAGALRHHQNFTFVNADAHRQDNTCRPDVV